MRVEIGLMTLAFFGGMVVQDQVRGDEVKWVDYGENPMENPEFMADWMASQTPGAEHEHLAASAGQWKVDATMWMDPKAPPMESQGVASRRMIMGGRYLIEEYKSEFMGMPFEGMLLQGYDNLKQEHWGIWVDNMSTWPSISTGRRDANGALTYTGLMHDISTPGGRPYKHVVREKNADETQFDMYDSTPDGTEFKVMGMTYRREAQK
jgi:hypothetical protein